MKLRRANKIIVTIETHVLERCDLQSETNTRNRIQKYDGKETKKKKNETGLNWHNEKSAETRTCLIIKKGRQN